jgi:hypothetical protein
MKYLSDFKLYEGVYDDMLVDINKKQEEISKLKDTYLSLVKDCLLEITDEFQVHALDYSRNIDNTTTSDPSYSEYEIFCEISVKQSDIEKFMESFIKVTNLIKSYLSNELSVEIIGAYMGGESFNSIGNFNDEFNYKASNDEKLDLFKKYISDIFEQYPDEDDDILIEMIIL